MAVAHSASDLTGPFPVRVRPGGKSDHVRLDAVRGGWLTPDEIAVWDEFAAMPFGENLDEGDVVAVFGAAGGGIAAYVKQCRPAHLILVEDDEVDRHLLEMSWRGARGVTIVADNPIAAMPEILNRHLPSVAIVDLSEWIIDIYVIQALARPNDSLDILCIRYGEMNERTRAVDDMVRTWHEGELRWRARKHNGPLGTQLYVR